MAVVTSSRVGFGVASCIPDNFCTIRNRNELTQQHQRKRKQSDEISFIAFFATVALYSVSFKHYHTFRGCMYVPRRQFLNESQYATAVATEIQFYFITIIFIFMVVVTLSCRSVSTFHYG